MSSVSKNKKLKKKKQSSFLAIIKSQKFLAIFFIIIILFVGFIAFIKLQLKPVIETRKTEVSTIPGIKQNQANRFFLYRLRPGYRTGEVLLKYLQQEQFRPW